MHAATIAIFVVVLVSAMVHGLKPEWVQRIREQLGIDQRTLKRWRRWWLGTFVQSAFWKAAKGRFMPPLDEKTLPWPLTLAFGSARVAGVQCPLEFLAPLTTHANAADRAM